MSTQTKASRRPGKAKRQPKRMAIAGKHFVSPSQPFEVKRFCGRYKIVRPDLTRLTGYSLRSVDKWASGEPPSGPARKQLAELVRLFDALTEIMEPDYIGEWLKTPNPAFEGSTPLQVIERGEADRLWRMLYLIETGEPV
jgi:hypothetical protein